MYKIKIGYPVVVKRDIEYGQGNLYKGYEAILEYIDENNLTPLNYSKIISCQIRYNGLLYWISICDIEIDFRKIRKEKLKNIISDT